MRWLAVLGFTTLATIAAAGAVTGPARADTAQGGPSCAVSYLIEAEWSGGFTAQIAVDYTGFPVRVGWELTFDFVSPGQRVVTVPNEEWYQLGGHVVVINKSQATPVNGSLAVGFVGAYSDGNPPPVNYTFDGVACTTAVPT